MTHPGFLRAPLSTTRILLLCTCAVVAACTEDTRPTDTGASMDSGSGPDGAAGDASADAMDAGSDAVSGAECTFNDDCVAAERCECEETTGCFCRPGTRGTGQNGIDECTSGNDCASAVCVEGPPTDPETFYCSGPCVTDDDCTGMLPLCLDVAFVGRICVREPPMS